MRPTGPKPKWAQQGPVGLTWPGAHMDPFGSPFAPVAVIFEDFFFTAFVCDRSCPKIAHVGAQRDPKGCFWGAILKKFLG